MQTIGPMMLDIASTSLSKEDIRLLGNPLVGGVILFTRNFESAKQVLDLTNQIRCINPGIIIAVDQEGGRVQRFKPEFSKLPALGNLGELATENLELAEIYAEELGELMALEVQAVGCDISFAPVLDLGNRQSRVIGDRAFALQAKQIVPLAKAYIQGMKKGGMLATGKHFPGHGSIEGDSHFEMPIDQRSYAEMSSQDLVPFSRLAADLGAMMPAHVVYPEIDKQPAGFSPVWLKDILRQQLGFNGVIFSDDLSMKGAESAGDYVQRAKLALDAGCDMVLVCNQRQAAIEVLEGLADYQQPTVSTERLARLKATGTPIGLEHLKQSKRWQDLAVQLNKFNRLINEE